MASSELPSQARAAAAQQDAPGPASPASSIGSTASATRTVIDVGRHPIVRTASTTSTGTQSDTAAEAATASSPAAADPGDDGAGSSFREAGGGSSPPPSTNEDDATAPPRLRVRAVVRSRNLLVPPLNFAMVQPGTYRSGYPNPKNFPFLRKLGIRSIVYLCPEPYLEDNERELEAMGVRIHQFKTEGNLEPFVDMDGDMVLAALRIAIDPRHHPVLIHCQKGNHRTGCLVGCLRRLQRWSLAAVLDEYRRFTGPNVRVLDWQFIERFDVSKAMAFLLSSENNTDSEQDSQAADGAPSTSAACASPSAFALPLSTGAGAGAALQGMLSVALGTSAAAPAPGP